MESLLGSLQPRNCLERNLPVRLQNIVRDLLDQLGVQVLELFGQGLFIVVVAVLLFLVALFVVVVVGVGVVGIFPLRRA